MLPGMPKIPGISSLGILRSFYVFRGVFSTSTTFKEFLEASWSAREFPRVPRSSQNILGSSRISFEMSNEFPGAPKIS